MGVLLEAAQELLQAVLHIRKGDTEADFLGIGSKLVMEAAAANDLGAEPAPALAAVGADGRAADTYGQALEGQRPSLSAADAKAPVEPVACRVTQVPVQLDIVPIDLVHDDVAAGEVGIDLRLLVSRPAGRHEARPDA